MKKTPLRSLSRPAVTKAIAWLVLGMAFLQSPAFVFGADPLIPEQTAGAKVQLSDPTDEPQAVVLSARGNCDYSEDGVNFVRLKPGRVLKEGAVLRTAEDSRADIFFRRIGIAVRLQPDTEFKIEKMTRRPNGGSPVMETLLDLRRGRVFTVVRSFITGSTFEVKNRAGRSVIEGGGEKGRYIITADGTHVTDKDSDVPLKLIGETGVTIVKPGQKFLAKEGKLFPLEPPEAVKSLIDFDELRALAEQADALANEKPSPKK
jgi:hypothetical protein